MSKREVWFARNEEAEALEHEGRLDEALARYQENAREGCDIPFTHERIASIQRKLGRTKEAVAAYDRAIELEKKRGPSDRLVRLQEKRTVVADLAARPAKPAPRAAKREASAPARASGRVNDEAKGCMSKAAMVLMIMTMIVAVLGSLIH